MSKDKIKNKRIFACTLAGFSIAGLVTGFYTYKANAPINIQKLSANKDSFDYTKNINIEALLVNNVISGEKVHISKEDQELYKKTTPVAFIKKILRLAYKNTGIDEASTYYEAAHNSKPETGDNPTKYKIAKSEHISKYRKEVLKNKPMLTANEVFVIDSADGYDYIKEVIAFINPSDYKIESLVEINSKFNHKKDKLEHSSITQVSKSVTDSLNKLFTDSHTAYRVIQESSSKIAKDYKTKHSDDANSIHIIDRSTVSVKGNKNTNTARISVK